MIQILYSIILDPSVFEKSFVKCSWCFVHCGKSTNRSLQTPSKNTETSE